MLRLAHCFPPPSLPTYISRADLAAFISRLSRTHPSLSMRQQQLRWETAAVCFSSFSKLHKLLCNCWNWKSFFFFFPPNHWVAKIYWTKKKENIWFSNQRPNCTLGASDPNTHYSKYWQRNYTRRSSFPFSISGSWCSLGAFVSGEEETSCGSSERRSGEEKKKLFVLISWRNETDADSFKSQPVLPHTTTLARRSRSCSDEVLTELFFF